MNWQPHQIVYLQADRVRLFAEVIQVVADRRVLWLRPLALQTPYQAAPYQEIGPTSTDTHDDRVCPEDVHPDQSHQAIYDLRQSSDLLWPMERVQVALDVEILPILAQLGPESPKLDLPNRIASQHLCAFIQQLYHSPDDAQ